MNAKVEETLPGKPKDKTEKFVDPDVVRELARLLVETDLAEIEVEKGGTRIRVSRQVSAVAVPIQPVAVGGAGAVVAQQQTAPISAAAAPAKPADHPGAVTSPMVGTVYLRPSPESATFVDIGSKVAAGDKLLLIEAMKTFNDIVAPRAGTVTAILVEDGQPVEYGEPLLVIE
jgi:acetyl-CoA carboxylase biotin carboxyl carrier protein